MRLNDHTHRTTGLVGTPPNVNNKSKGPAPARPSILANDIDGACDCVNHQRLHKMMSSFKLPTCLSGTIRNFLAGRTISLTFREVTEPPAPFLSGLPQGSPLSPVLFILYSSAQTTFHLTAFQAETCYVDDEVLTHGASTMESARKLLQVQLDKRIARTTPVNIRFSPDKSELMHMIPTTSKLDPNTPDQSVILYDGPIEPKKQIKSLGVIIDH